MFVINYGYMYCYFGISIVFPSVSEAVSETNRAAVLVVLSRISLSIKSTVGFAVIFRFVSIIKMFLTIFPTESFTYISTIFLAILLANDKNSKPLRNIQYLHLIEYICETSINCKSYLYFYVLSLLVSNFVCIFWEIFSLLVNSLIIERIIVLVQIHTKLLTHVVLLLLTIVEWTNVTFVIYK